MTPSQRNRVMKMKEAGFSGREIARTLKLPQSAVWDYLKAKGFGRPKSSKDHHKEVRADIRSLNRKFERCPGCGAKAQLNNRRCLACELTEQRKPATRPITSTASL